ncbi:MAG: bifunctional riboflavin kinase/FAD synthetase [Candidatus Acidiferrales bacterium]
MSLRVCHAPAQWVQSVRAGVPGRSAVLTIGTFDGLHLGHQHILTKVVEVARQSAHPTVAGAVTFDPHPSRVLRPEHAPPMIATLAQRLEGFERCGLEAVLVLAFDLPLARLSAEAFVNSILVEQLYTSAVLVGENFRFGHRQAGDVRMLTERGQRFGFAVEVVPPVKVNGEVVSSTAIRRAIEAGDVARAAALLGRPFALTGGVVPGSGQGRKHLVPTLNLAHEQELLPRYGVYVTEVQVSSEICRAVTNVGVRPTLDGAKLAVESHLLDVASTLEPNLSREMASGRIAVRFLSRLRDEKKFESLDALREQIHRDIAAAREYFSAVATR